MKKKCDPSFINAGDLHYMQGYEQGRADERKEWERSISTLLVKYAGDIYSALPDIVKNIQDKARADAIDELLEMMKPCNNCPSYPNECNDKDYFEDCCRTEQSISWEDLRIKAEQLKEQKNE